jgi:hypothetical protein
VILVRIEIWREDKGMEIGVSLDFLVQRLIWLKVSSYRIARKPYLSIELTTPRKSAGFVYILDIPEDLECRVCKFLIESMME